MTIRSFFLALAVVALAACGSGEQESITDPAQPASKDSTVATAGEPPTKTESSARKGHCALIEPSEIEAAFPMDLKLGKPRAVGRTDTPIHACQVELGIGEVGQLSFGTTNEGTYNEYAKYLEQSSTPSRRIDGLGEEAFLLNNAQLLVRRTDGRFLNISVMLITMGGPPLSQEDMAEAVVQLGTMMNERL